jgi:enoyl-CoA hydratase
VHGARGRIVTIDQRTIDDGIVLLTLNRPERLNALDQDHVGDLLQAFDDLSPYGRTRVVILTGAGRAFCAGLDLKDSGDVPGQADLGTVQWSMLFQKRFASLVQRLRRIPPIVIAAVNGAAVGAGCALALASDVRVVGPDGSFSVANVKIGLSGGDVGTSYHLPRLVGMNRAAEMMLTGRRVDSEEADRIGLAFRADDAVTAATELARQITANSPFGVWMTKEVMWSNVDATSLDAALDLEDRTQVLASLTADMHEAVAAFGERRPPRFTNH